MWLIVRHSFEWPVQTDGVIEAPIQFVDCAVLIEDFLCLNGTIFDIVDGIGGGAPKGGRVQFGHRQWFCEIVELFIGKSEEQGGAN